MSLLFRILRATHARGTHHKLALDALHRMRTPDAGRWERVFLEHAELYMTGAKAPDDEFKDFKNHVLHPRDGYWGGAPEKVESWYAHLVAALKAGQWSEAVWCAGVLSHYATDPVHPFHTAQSEAENAIHRATEWSINRSYDTLWAEAIARHAGLDVEIPAGPNGLKEMIFAAADRANAQYEKLIAHYDVNRGVVEPAEGLDSVSRALVGELLVYAATLNARLLDRAIAESGAAPPEVSLGIDTIVAALKIPVKSLLKKLADAEDRRIVEAMYDELKATG
ncbi:MAG: zinc dependent phospholipase C family protein, partial [Candidatus Sumerlaeia bacterium]|nr:zinc dependent phospholipase C family protein [Candidatus Sumerlaeia bacterium]